MNRDYTKEFKGLIKNTLTKSLKELGFKKSNFNFVREINGITQTCNVQRSMFNHIDSTSFTINFGFFIPIVYELIRNSAEKLTMPKVDNCHINGRTGHLIYGFDYWYEINENITFESIQEKLSNDVLNFLTPMFEKTNSVQAILELVRPNYEKRKYDIIVDIDATCILELEFGEYLQGKNILVSEFDKAIIPQSIQSKTIYPDGREDIRWSEPRVNEYHINLLNRIAKKYNIELK